LRSVLLGLGGPITACGGNGSNSTGGTPEDSPELKGITEAHNAARASVSPAPQTAIPALQWSTEIAKAAQDWADNCQFQHSSSDYGENIYADTGQGSAADVVADWVSEEADYNYASNSCSGVCGHYTQVVWAKSLNLGCAMTRCTRNSPFGGFGGGVWNFWVCNYDPPGNFNNQRPY
jgi:pathogenesis-related protein 1